MRSGMSERWASTTAYDMLVALRSFGSGENTMWGKQRLLELLLPGVPS